MQLTWLYFFVLLSPVVSDNRVRVTNRRHNIYKRAESCNEQYPPDNYGNTHTFCLEPTDKNTNTEGVPTMTESSKQIILEAHIKLRASSGATDMQKPVWDDRLAVMAQAWAEQCEVMHDKNNYIREYGMRPGQNLGVGQRTWQGVLNGWAKEIEYFKYGHGAIVDKMIGHYTQMVQRGVSRIGCGFANCSTPYRRYYICNYLEPNRDWKTPYTKGPKCEDCPNSCDEATGLCDCKGLYCFNEGIMDVDACQCQCGSAFYGKDCMKPRCPGLYCQNFGSIDPNTCTCRCLTTFLGIYCEKQHCPHLEQRFCGRHWKAIDCIRYINVKFECPFLCGICAESDRPTCKDDPYCHQSTIGCKYLGIQPSKQVCDSFGVDGEDKPRCTNLLNQGFSWTCEQCSIYPNVKTMYCPNMCGYCRTESGCSGTVCFHNGILNAITCECSCVAGHAGDYCENKPCFGKICFNGGTLILSTCECTCTGGYGGDDCFNEKCIGLSCADDEVVQTDDCTCVEKGALTTTPTTTTTVSTTTAITTTTTQATMCGNAPIPEGTFACCNDDDIYDTRSQLCCGDSVHTLNVNKFGCCFKRIYKTRSQLCCQKRFYNRRPPRYNCCGRYAYRMDNQLCCNGKIAGRNPLRFRCCGRQPFRLRTNHCCDNEVRKGNIWSRACCDGVSYKQQKEICCSGTLHPRQSPFSACCGQQVYVTWKEICCDGIVFSRSPPFFGCCGTGVLESPMQLCCNTTVLMRIRFQSECCGEVIYDTSKEMCCGGQVMATLSAASGCCIDVMYDTTTHICCEGTIFNQSSLTHECCDNHAYDPIEAICCSGVAHDYSSDENRCCGSVPYNPNSQICCSGFIVRGELATHKCCGSAAYDISTQLCCDEHIQSASPHEGDRCCLDRVYDSRVDLCCGDRVFVGDPWSFACCGDKSYDIRSKLCCDNNVRNSYPLWYGCCGSRVYYKYLYKCCKDMYIKYWWYSC